MFARWFFGMLLVVPAQMTAAQQADKPVAYDSDVQMCMQGLSAQAVRAYLNIVQRCRGGSTDCAATPRAFFLVAQKARYRYESGRGACIEGIDRQVSLELTIGSPEAATINRLLREIEQSPTGARNAQAEAERALEAYRPR